MQTEKALNILEALIVLTGKPELTLAQACGILRALQFNVAVLPTSDATPKVKNVGISASDPSQATYVEPVAKLRKKPGPKPGSKPGKKKIGRPRKDAQ